MPICKVKGLYKRLPSPVENFNDDDEVFYCETTKEIFHNYKEYFQRIMLVNSTIWACEYTGRENLTYTEALKSEKKARKTAKSFKEILRAPVLLVVKKAQQSWHKTLLNIVYQFIKDRYFRGEIVRILRNFRSVDYKVLEVIAPEKVPENGVYVSSDIKYKVQKHDSKGSNDICILASSELKRHRYDLTHENLQCFLKDNIELTPEGILRPKEEAYKKYISERRITFKTIFVGDLPDWKPAKIKKIIHAVKVTERAKSEIVKEKKQETLSKYLVKKNGENSENGNDQKEVERLLKERMEKLQKLKELKIAELERKRLERQEKIEKILLKLTTKSEDLEREDQKPLPLLKSVKTIIPLKYFGDLLQIKEFIQSHGEIMAINPFKSKISFYEICRAFTVHELAGPLSDIVELLLKTIFVLQYEEEDECKVLEKLNTSHVPDMQKASWTHRFIEKHYSRALNKLPVNALSLSEILRLHFLGSGACTDARSRTWRFTYRNGYTADEDPGLELKRKQPHILRALKTYTLHQLPLSDIIKIIKCLISQILTYSGYLNLLEERIEALAEFRKKLKVLQISESKRISSMLLQKKALLIELGTKVKEITDEVEKKKVQDEINRKIERLVAQDDFGKKKYERDICSIEENIIDYILFLGSDRAYRNYYIFESLPGIFVEHSPQCYDTCLENPPKNDHELAYGPRYKKDMKTILSKRLIQEEKENQKERMTTKLKGKANKENQTLVNGDITKINGATTILPVNSEVRPELPSPYDLWMCTGNPHHCIVHDEKNPERSLWSFIDSEKQLEELIAGLNPYGLRESILREQLVSFKSLIIQHLSNCPTDMIHIEESMQTKFVDKMMVETNKKYRNSNYGFDTNIDINEVMHAALVDEILQFEESITVGFLGVLKVNDLEQWRNDISNNSYNSQCKKLVYGEKEDGQFIDPGDGLGDTIDIESEDSDDGITLHTSPELLKTVKTLASALLQIEQSIEERFFKEPFGIKSDKFNTDDEKIKEGKTRLKQWEISLMASTSYSQVYLHKCILSDAVKWYKSITRARCIVCHRKGDEEKLLLCDNCNAGTHTICLKPILKSIPEGNWYCQKCQEKKDLERELEEGKKKTKTRRTIFKHNEDDDDDDAEDRLEFGLDIYAEKNTATASDDEAANDRTCYACFEDGAENECSKCTYWYHLRCVQLKRKTGPKWRCSTCRMKDKKRKLNESDSDSEDNDEILSMLKLKRIKTDVSDNESDEGEQKQTRHKKTKATPTPTATPTATPPTRTTTRASTKTTINNRRSARSIPDDLPLNSAVLYNLLDEIMKRDDAWPFIRPVTQNELPDYQQVIKAPMDFGKVKSNLNMACYSSNEEVMKDIELVFKNCDLYYTEGHAIYKAGLSLEKFVMKACQKLHLPFTPSDMITESGYN